MVTLFGMAAMSSDAKIAVGVGVVVFAILFFKLLRGFIRFFFRHPFWFILLLVFGGIGFAFNILLGGAVILAALVGGGAFMLLGNFDN